MNDYLYPRKIMRSEVAILHGVLVLATCGLWSVVALPHLIYGLIRYAAGGGPRQSPNAVHHRRY